MIEMVGALKGKGGFENGLSCLRFLSIFTLFGFRDWALAWDWDGMGWGWSLSLMIYEKGMIRYGRYGDGHRGMYLVDAPIPRSIATAQVQCETFSVALNCWAQFQDNWPSGCDNARGAPSKTIMFFMLIFRYLCLLAHYRRSISPRSRKKKAQPLPGTFS